MTAGGFVAGVAFVVCAALHIASFLLNRGDLARAAAREAQRHPLKNQRAGQNNSSNLRNKVAAAGASVDVNVNEESSGFCSKKSFYFLVPPKVTTIELITVLALAPLYGFLVTYFCHPETTTMILKNDDKKTECVVLALIVVFFSSYSLLSLAIPEVTPYGTDDSFSVFSHHYQRIYYQIVLVSVLLVAEKGF